MDSGIKKQYMVPFIVLIIAIAAVLSGGIIILFNMGMVHARGMVIFLAAILIAFAAIGVWTLNRTLKGISEPINALSKIAARIGRGEYDVDIPIDRPDEIGMLAESFRSMIADLKSISGQRIAFERELRESEEKYRNLVERANDGIIIVQEGFVQFANQYLRKLGGYSDEDIVGKPFSAFIAPDELPHVADIYRRRMAGEDVESVYESVLLTKDGSRVEVEINAALVPHQGKPTDLIIVRDLAERRKTEAKIRRLSQFAEQNYNPVIELQADGRLIYANRAAVDLAMSFDQNDPLSLMPRNITSLLRECGESGRSHRNIEVDLDNRTLVWSFFPIKESGTVHGYGMEITQQKILERQSIQSQKIESLGTLAGGIAHDFNNLLTAILGGVSLARLDLDPQSEESRYLGESENACHRARDLTKQLLTFSRGGAPVKKILSVRGVIEETARFALTGAKVKSFFDMEEKLWMAEIDSGQFSQAINNLVINAEQAMPSGGIIAIEARNFTVEDGTEMLNGLPLDPGSYIRVSIKDQGTGIPDKYLTKIFDPYFTTKQKGSGLGLSTAYSILKNHGGHIQVESKLGTGSKFTFYLPAKKVQATPIQKKPDKPISGHGRILVMDDEAAVRKIAKRMLESMGFTVELAEDGEKTIELYRHFLSSEQTFDFLIMDLTVPGRLGGLEALVELKKIDATVKAVASSGYSTNAVMAEYQSYGFADVLAKPYTIEDLGRVIRRLIPE